MELKPEDLRRVACEFVLFNRQRVKYSDQTVKRIIVDYSGKLTVIHKKKIANYQELNQFFKQIKSIYFDGKMVACRASSDLPLLLSNYHFSKMKNRKLLLDESDKAYRKLKKEDLQKCK